MIKWSEVTLLATPSIYTSWEFEGQSPLNDGVQILLVLLISKTWPRPELSERAIASECDGSEGWHTSLPDTSEALLQV